MLTNRIALSCAAILMASASATLAQQQTVGLFVNEPEAQPGYTLFSPLRSNTTYLIDIDGRIVHSWQTTNYPGLMAYLLEDGHLLRAAAIAPDIDPVWNNAIGGGGRIEEYDWDGNLTWSFRYSDALNHQHHDFKKLPNGNVLFITWTYKSPTEAIDAGRDPGRTSIGGFWPDAIIELRPTGPTTGDIAWEWHVWDHLVQDFDPAKANYGVVADHPELFDINAITDDGQSDFNHFNGVEYNPALDQIMISSRGFNEIYIIDHSTTTAEAASHAGGNSGMGGDILYRWGNPAKYDRGTAADRKLFNQHDAQWVAPGQPGEGNVVIFNNGASRPGGAYSSADEIVLPINASNTYDLAPGMAYGPAAPTWTYVASPPGGFLSPIIGGVQRQPNGNTLICEGTKGNLFEVTPAGQVVWRYVNPVVIAGPLAQGSRPAPGIAQENAVFKTRRYPADYPGLAGRTLTPGDVIEIYDAPSPAPDGRFGTAALRASKLDAAGSQVRVTWDAASCPSPDYNLLFGPLAAVSSMGIGGSACALGAGGVHDWSGVPAGDHFFLIVGIGDFPLYESSWGTDSFGNERNGTRPSRECGALVKSTSLTCP